MTDDDRVSVIHRLRFLAKERESFKAFISTEIETQYACLLAARKEVDKFDLFLGDEAWPDDMENIRRSMLQTTLLDEVVEEHSGGEAVLLPAMVNAYVKATGAHGSQRVGQYKRLREMENSDNADEIVASAGCRGTRRADSDDCSNFEGDSDGIEVTGNSPQSPTSSSRKDSSNSDQEAADNVEEVSDTTLANAGIELRIQMLLEYERGSSDIDGSFDFIIAYPFQKVGSDPGEGGRSNRCSQSVMISDELVDEKGETLYVQSLRRVLKRGGFSFIFLDWNRIRQWRAICIESKFEGVCDASLVMKDPERVQKMKLNGLQTLYEPALVLQKPGKHPEAFEMDKSSPYTYLLACRMPRWCNIIDSVPPPAQKVTFKPSRAQIRPNEKPCSVYIELLQTFCPPSGKVLDPIVGTLTTDLACMATGRRCFLLVTDQKCVSQSMPRAIEFALSKGVHPSSNVDEGEYSSCNEICTTQEKRLGDRDSNNRIESGENSDTATEGSEIPVEVTSHRSGGLERDLEQGPGKKVDPAGQVTNASNSLLDENYEAHSANSERDLGVSKQISFVNSMDLRRQRSQRMNRDDNVTTSSAASEVSTPTIKKCSRKIRSPVANRSRIAESTTNTTPSISRRSKRSRKPTSRFEQ